MFLDFVLIGLVKGSTYALLAIGLTLIYGILGVLNFAQGVFAVAGVYIVYGMMVHAHVGFALAIVCAAVIAGFLGFLLVELVLEPLIRRGAPPLATMLATLAAGVAGERAIELIAGVNPVSVPVGLASKVVTIGSATINDEQLVGAGVAAVLVLFVHIGVRYTRLGQQARAIAQNRVGAALSGVNIRAVQTSVFVAGTALAAVAGALVLSSTPLTPTAGLDLTITAFIVVIAGGLGSILGATVMGLALGVVETLTGAYWQPVFAPVGGYIFMILIILYRPRGLLRA